MNELLQRIMQAAPERVELDDKDYAWLCAHLSVKTTTSFFEMRYERAAYLARQEQRRHLLIVRNYNQQIREMKVPLSRPAKDQKPSKGKSGSPPPVKSRAERWAEDARVAAAWAPKHFPTFEDLGRTLGMTGDEVRRAVERHAKRNKRRANNTAPARRRTN